MPLDIRTLTVNGKLRKEFKAMTTTIAASTSNTVYTTMRALTYCPVGLTPLTAIKFNAYRTAGTGQFSIRIFDVTNAVVIAEATGLTNTTAGIFTIPLLNVPAATEATWQVQTRMSSGSGTVFTQSIQIVL